ncbi:hypothetical protein DFH28DRAFT_887071, partial [Melampsora americana]
QLLLASKAKSASRKLKIAEKRLTEARRVLDELTLTTGLTIEYFSEQWERQKLCQSELMKDSSLQNLQARLQCLIELEEDFKQAHDDFDKLRRKRRRTLSEEEHKTLRALPSTLVSLEDSITDLVIELGGDEFRDMPEVKDPKARLMLRVRVSKEKLYEAKVGKVEWQKKWDQPGIGNTDQARYKRVMDRRNKALLQKYNSYKTSVETFHETYPDSQPLHLPTIEEVKALDITDVFWNIGHLTHPNEPWAVDLPTQTGIQAFRTARSGEEELERISCELQNMVRFALKTEEKLTALLELSELGWVDGCPDGKRPVELVLKSGLVSKSSWELSQKVLKALHNRLTRKSCRTWMVWNSSLPFLLQTTAQYSAESIQSVEMLVSKWKGLIQRSTEMWEKIVHCPSVAAQAMDELELIEQRFMIAEDDVGIQMLNE